MTDTARLERRGLLLTVFAALLMAVLGLTFSVPARSEAIMLDGVYSLVNFAVGLISLKVVALVQRPVDGRYPFGYAAYEPAVNLVKGLMVASISVIACWSAVEAVLAGGREVKGAVGLTYALLAAGGCFATAIIQKRLAARTASPILAVDYRNWLIDGGISAVVAVAFGIVLLIENTTLAWFVPYTDSTLVIVLVLFSISVPLGVVRRNWGQLMGRGPHPELHECVSVAVTAALTGLPVLDTRVRLLEMGRTLYLEVAVVVDDPQRAVALQDLDAVRDDIAASLADLEQRLDLTVTFTGRASQGQRDAPAD